MNGGPGIFTLIANTTDARAPTAVFLARHGLAGARVVLLSSHASARRFFLLPDHRLLLLDDWTNPAGVAACAQVSRHLNRLGLSASKVRGVDVATGLALVEDFGQATYSEITGRGADETRLYELAIHALVHLHHRPGATSILCCLYDRRAVLVETDVTSSWFAPQLGTVGAVEDFAEVFRDLWSQAFASNGDWPQTLDFQDFHGDNLMLLEQRTGVARCGLLEFQDAVVGPLEYDLVSVLQGARRDLGPGLEDRMLDRYLKRAPATAKTRGDIVWHNLWLGAQQHARIAGVVARLWFPGYLRFLPRALGHLETALKRSGLIRIEAVMNRFLPDWRVRGSSFAAEDLEIQGVPA
ncbi:aminoglycoside phosphotransferase family protein [Ruegeria sp. PrR005]|uniref:Phosphotransferase n=1 Tax=Ruegeria sp. PrR005 TaxID=2706882 RepID=A0A6B2NNS2_9RHOB|nr:phosphotransferase [Ruegeria sp. PrR005]NDW44159.1 phosphotransferase [Ruegeria sp. PrR005]